MNKKALLGSAAAILAGIGIYKYINTQSNNPGENWTTADIPNLTGKVMIVTGANKGLGFETAKEFAAQGRANHPGMP